MSPEPPDWPVLDREQALAPVAGRAARLGASGVELLCLTVLELVGLALGPATFFGAGVLTSLVAAAFWALRDLGAGAASPGKQLVGLALVDANTGAPATAGQALQRNGAMVFAWLLAALPGPLGWLGALAVLGVAAVEAGSALLDPEGRRLGDRIAGTRLVARRRE